MEAIDIIDPEVFDDLLASTGADPGFLSELMDAYFQDGPRLLADMRAALAAGSAPEFRRAAHSLKSNSANFGARNLAALCKELEDMGRAEGLAGAGEKLAAAEAEYMRVQTALEEKRSEITR